MYKKLIIIPTIASLIFSAALPVLANEKNSSDNDNNRAKIAITTQFTAVVGACMQTAVEKRDNAVIALVNTYNSSLVAALQTRRDALKAAWGIMDRDARNAALKTEWTNFRNSHRQAITTKRAARQAAWKQFRTDARICNPRGIIQSDSGRNGEDNQL